MSRIGRNYLEVGLYTDVLFRDHNIRFIAVNSGVDSANQQDNDFTPFLIIINVLYCFSTVFTNGTKAHHIAKSTCNHLVVRAAVTSAFSYPVLFIACCAATARERTRAGEMYRYNQDTFCRV